MLSWALVGMYAGPVIYFYLPVTLIFMKGRDQYLELLLGFIFILILSDSRVGSLQFAVNAKEIYIILLAVFLVIDSKGFAPFNNFYFRFFPFFTIAIICIFYAPSESLVNSIEKTASYIFLLLVVPNYVQKAHLMRGKEFYKMLVYLCAGILLLGFVFKFLSPDIVTREDRYEGMFGNPNGLGIFCLLLFLLFTVVIDFFPDLFGKREKMFIYGYIVLSVLLSGSRGSLFGLIIYVVFTFLYKRSAILGTIVAIVFATTYSYISANLVGIINTIGLQNYLRINTLEEASGRFVAWKFTWEHIQENFWIGRGFEYTSYLFSIPKNVEYLQALGHLGNVHNSYLTLWLDTGLIGLSCFVFAFMSSFIKGIKKTALALPIMYAVIFSSFFESWLTASLNPFTILLFIILSIITNDVIVTEKAKVAVSL